MNHLKLITTIGKVTIRSNLLSLRLPQLDRYKIEEIVCRSADGKYRELSRMGRRYQVNVIDLRGRESDFEFYVFSDPEDLEVMKNPECHTALSDSVRNTEDPVSKGRLNAVRGLRNRSAKQAEKQRSRKADINDPNRLLYEGLRGQRILTFGNPACWARGLGMINKANQLREQIGMDLHRYYTLVSGQGYGAILAAAISAGIDMNTLMTWWTNDFKKVHTPNIVQGMMRTVVKFLKPSESGFSHKQATKALRRLFSRGLAPLRLRDVQIELQIKVIFSDLKVGTYSSCCEEQSDLTLAEIATDAAITRNDYNARSTIKGEPPFLGEVEKNDVLGFLVSPDGTQAQITCIDAPVRVDPENAGALERKSDTALKIIKQAQYQHIYQMRLGQVIDKLKVQGSDIKLMMLQCESLDHIVRNSTTRIAQKAGISSGTGKIVLPDWFENTLQRQILG